MLSFNWHKLTIIVCKKGIELVKVNIEIGKNGEKIMNQWKESLSVHTILLSSPGVISILKILYLRINVYIIQVLGFHLILFIEVKNLYSNYFQVQRTHAKLGFFVYDSRSLYISRPGMLYNSPCLSDSIPGGVLKGRGVRLRNVLHFSTCKLHILNSWVFLSFLNGWKSLLNIQTFPVE